MVDYRFYCFNGKPEIIYQYINESQKDNSKPEPSHCNIYDVNWKLLDVHQKSLPTERKYPMPKSLKKMVELATKLSKGVAFLRVDFYEVNGKPLCGELTFYPGSGMSKFYPEEWDRKLGDMIDLSRVKN